MSVPDELRVGWSELTAVHSVVLLLERDFTILARSDTFARRMSDARVGVRLDELMTCQHPEGIRSDRDIGGLGRQLFHWVSPARGFAMRGQFLALADGRGLLFVGSPWLAWMQQHAPEIGLELQDFGPADTQLDQLFHLSAEHQMVADLEALNEELRAASDAAAAATKAKSAFLALISHEMRTPLNGIITGLNLLEDTALDEAQGKLVATVQGSARTMLSVINSVLDFSRLEAGHLEIEVTTFDLEDLVDTVVQVHALRAEARAVKLAREIYADAKGGWQGDDAKIRQILINLVSNAVNFTSHGRVMIRVEPAPGGLRFEVQDTGAGIPEEDYGKIFDPFFTRRTDSASGTGLGLGFVRRLVGELGGTLDFRSRVGLGTRFWFTLPLERAPAAGEATTIADPEPDRRRFRGRVLIAEDNPTNLLLGRMMLEKLGVRAEGVSNGAEAVDMLSRVRFDLVLMDITMPIVDGISATRRVRELLGDDAPPIVALTAHAGAEDRQRYLAAGMVDHLVKPVSPRQLADTLARHLALEVPDMDETSAPTGDEAVVDDGVLRALVGEIGLENVQRVLVMFRGELRSRIEAIRDAASKADWAAVASASHTLRSSVASVGGRRLAARLTTIELQARTGAAVPDRELAGLGELSVRTYTEISEALRTLAR